VSRTLRLPRSKVSDSALVPNRARGDRHRLWQASGLASLTVLVVGNLVWIHHFRYGLPLNIDEAGYLQRGIQFAQSLDAGNVPGLLHVWQTPDIIAPLLPFTAGVLEAISHMSVWGVLGTEQLFYALTVVASFLLARTMSTLRWSLVIAGTVASLPGLLDASRLFFLAVPVTALFTLTLFFQVRAKTILPLRSAIAWGASLGLLSLTRTMVISLIPAFVVVAILRVLGEPRTLAAARNLCSSLVVAVVVALSWYWTSWHAVYDYLTQYGYGNQASFYTGGHALNAWGRVSQRFGDIANQDLFLPLLLALTGAMIVSLSAKRWRSTRPWKHPHLSAPTKLRGRQIMTAIQGLVSTGERSVIAIWLICLIVLASSSNGGSYFELTLVPPIVISILIPIGRADRRRRLLTAGLIATACGLTLLDQFGFTPFLAKYSYVSWSRVSLTAFNDSPAEFVGAKLRALKLGGVFWSNCGGATVTCFYGRSSSISTAYLEEWTILNTRVERFLYGYSSGHGYSPVVFFAYQGPLLNTNTIGLTAQVSGRTLPIGALVPPIFRQQISLRDQLELPQFGQPNLVVAEGPSPSGRNDGESSDRARTQVDTLLRQAGFSVVASFPLPGASAMRIWWKDR
jgi:hypothetical protein